MLTLIREESMLYFNEHWMCGVWSVLERALKHADMDMVAFNYLWDTLVYSYGKTSTGELPKTYTDYTPEGLVFGIVSSDNKHIPMFVYKEKEN